MGGRGLHQQLTYYFRSTLFQPVFNCKQLQIILDGYIQFHTAIYNLPQLHMNLEIFR